MGWFLFFLGTVVIPVCIVGGFVIRTRTIPNLTARNTLNKMESLHAEAVAEIQKNGEKPCKRKLILHGDKWWGGEYDYSTLDITFPVLVVTDQEMWIPNRPESTILSKNGVNNGLYKFEIKRVEVVTPTTVTKNASVVKRAVVGGVVAGGAGAVVGAISAADANAKGGVTKTVRAASGEHSEIRMVDYPTKFSTNGTLEETPKVKIKAIEYFEYSENEVPKRVYFGYEVPQTEYFGYLADEVSKRKYEVSKREYFDFRYGIDFDEAKRCIDLIDKVAKGEEIQISNYL